MWVGCKRGWFRTFVEWRKWSVGRSEDGMKKYGTVGADWLPIHTTCQIRWQLARSLGGLVFAVPNPIRLSPEIVEIIVVIWKGFLLSQTHPTQLGFPI